MPKPRCVCGCGQRSANMHHVVYAQKIRECVPRLPFGYGYEAVAAASRQQGAMLKDRRNLVPVAFGCHADHHTGAKRLPLAVLPDSVFEFAFELLGPAAFDYLGRRYGGDDARLDALLAEA